MHWEHAAPPLYWFVFSFAHRLEAKLEDLAPAEDEPEPKPKSKPIDLIEMERGELPSFMKPTARLVGYVVYCFTSLLEIYLSCVSWLDWLMIFRSSNIRCRCISFKWNFIPCHYMTLFDLHFRFCAFIRYNPVVVLYNMCVIFFTLSLACYVLLFLYFHLINLFHSAIWDINAIQCQQQCKDTLGFHLTSFQTHLQ